MLFTTTQTPAVVASHHFRVNEEDLTMTKYSGLLSLFLVSGCMFPLSEFPSEGNGPLTDNSLDSSLNDSSVMDTESFDQGELCETGEFDSSNLLDAALPDGASPELGEPDSGNIFDAGGYDSGNVLDTGKLDSGNVLDTGLPDGALAEAGKPDFGNIPDNSELDSGNVPDEGALDEGSVLDSGQIDVGNLIDAGCLDSGNVFDEGNVADSASAEIGEPDVAQPGCVRDDQCPAESYACVCQGNVLVCTLVLHQCLDGECQVLNIYDQCSYGCANNRCNPEPECEDNLGCDETMSCGCEGNTRVCQLEHRLCVDNVCSREETQEDCVFGCTSLGCNAPPECFVNEDCPLQPCSCQGADLVCQDPDSRCIRGTCMFVGGSTPCEFGCEGQACVIPECLIFSDCSFAQDCVDYRCVYDGERFICRFVCNSNSRAVVWTGSDAMETSMACRDSVFEFSRAQLCETGDPLPRMRVNMHNGFAYEGVSDVTFECNNPNFTMSQDISGRYPPSTQLVEFSTPACP